MSEFLIKSGETVVFAGDSITDCGRRDNAAPYGGGYVKQTIELIGARYPERRIAFFNAGISGNTVIDLKNRWTDDVLRHKPDWVTIKIGINDLHRTLNTLIEADKIGPTVFEDAYRTILTRTAESGAKIVLVDPFYLSAETDPSSIRSTVLEMLAGYIEVVDKLGKEFGTLRVKTHDLYQEQIKYRPADVFANEPVHPNTGGHLVIAHGLLQAFGW